jgi:predicted nuclease of predicted toxin-antitoxin system
MIYFVDINLPDKFCFFETGNFIFVKDISTTLSDNEIWELAIEKSYTILTRDKDFYYRALQSTQCPKVVLFRLGNTKNNLLSVYFTKHWEQIETHLQKHQLIVLWPNEIQIML